KK
ncbi:Late transcription factor VLTF-4 (1), partial [Monkeypox virus]